MWNAIENPLGVKASVHVEPLKRSKRDNLSAPSQVIELLEEYHMQAMKKECKNNNSIFSLIRTIPISTFPDICIRKMSIMF